MRETFKMLGRAVATVVVAPTLLSFAIRGLVIGRNRALEGSSQFLAIIPGLPGAYLRRAFLMRVLAHCDRTATVHFGTLLSQTGARLDSNVYVGPNCHLGLVHLERNVMLAAGVHVPSGPDTHGFDRIDRAISEQPGARRLVRIGEGTWVGSAAVVLADVGRHCVVGAGAVVTHPVPDYSVAVGVPARAIRDRRQDHAEALQGGGSV
jgi:acetyltransferase-like isoleucine patch superfamily enzyme